MNTYFTARSGRYEARILAVLVLLMVLILALFSDVFRPQRGCGWTVGQPSAAGQARGIFDWFVIK